MNDKERFILAEKIQKRVQGSQPHFQLIKRKEEIEKQLKEDTVSSNRTSKFVFSKEMKIASLFTYR